MTERMASVTNWFWRLDTGELKRFERRSRWWKATVQLGGDITKESEEMQTRRWKEAYEELKEMMAKRISFPQ